MEALDQAEVGVGKVIADTYEVTRLLGRGGMGAVWEARHVRLPGKRVAIKVLHPDVAEEEESLARFRREAEIASRLGHPNIIEVHDFNQLPESGAPYLILEYLEGESLDQRIARGALPLEEVMSIARQVGSGLRAAHEQDIIHRDLKPQNIFLVDKGGEEAGQKQVKILDFGISKIRGSDTIKTHDSTILGTPQYMAPEQAVGNHGAVNASTDVFAFGAILYEMLCGAAPFLGQTVPEVVFKVVYEAQPDLSARVPGLPGHVLDAIGRALEKKQEDRFPDMQECVSALTGRPLSRTPIPAPLPPASRDMASATARTMTKEELVAGTAQTLASTTAKSGLAPVATAQTMLATDVDTAPPAKSGSRIALSVLAASLGAAAVLALPALLSDDETPPQPAPRTATVAPATTTTVPGTTRENTEPEPVGAGPEVTETEKPPVIKQVEPPVTKQIETAPTKTIDPPPAKNADPRKPPENTTDTPSTLSPEATAALKRGRAAVSAGNAAEAIRQGKKAVRLGAGSEGWYLRGQGACMRRNLSNVRAAMRSLSGRQKRKLERFCARKDFDVR